MISILERFHSVKGASLISTQALSVKTTNAGLLLEDAESIGEWLDVDLLDQAGDRGEPPDMFVVGFQEVSVIVPTPITLALLLSFHGRGGTAPNPVTLRSVLDRAGLKGRLNPNPIDSGQTQHACLYHAEVCQHVTAHCPDARVAVRYIEA